MFYTIKRPLVTQKNNHLVDQDIYIYTFEVTLLASKLEIRRAIEKCFRVKVQSVRTCVCRTRSRRTKKGVSSVSYWKKAIVRLVPGQKISLFEGG